MQHQDTHPALPDDDSAVYEGRRLVLNRIDQEWGCDAVIYDGPLVPEHCGLPEHDPFTSRCWDHAPGNLTSGHM